MPIDTSMWAALARPQGESPLDTYLKLAQFRQMQQHYEQQNKLAALQIQREQMATNELQRQSAQAEAVRQSFAGAVVPEASQTVASPTLTVGSGPSSSVNVGGVSLPTLATSGVELGGGQQTYSRPAYVDPSKVQANLASAAPEQALAFQQQQDTAGTMQAEQHVKLAQALSKLNDDQRDQVKKNNQMMAQYALPVAQAEQAGMPQDQIQQIFQRQLQAAQSAGLDTRQIAQYYPGIGGHVVALAQNIDKALEHKAPNVQELGSGPQGPGKYAFNPQTGKYDSFVGALPKTVPAARITVQAPGASDSDPKDIADAIIRGDQPPTTQGLYRNAAPVRAELARRGFPMAKAEMDFKATQRFMNTMNGQQQVRLQQAISTASDSLDKLDALYSEFRTLAPTSGFKVINRASLAASKQLPGRAGAVAQALDAQIADLTSELGNVYMGGNSPTDHALGLAKQNLSADWNDETFREALKQARLNLGIRKNSILNSQPAGTTGRYMPQQNGPVTAPLPGTPAAAPAPTNAKDPMGIFQ